MTLGHWVGWCDCASVKANATGHLVHVPYPQCAGVLLVLHPGKQLRVSQIVVNPLLRTFGTPRKKKKTKWKSVPERNIPLNQMCHFQLRRRGGTFARTRGAAVKFQARLPRSSSAPEKQVDSQGLTQQSLPLFLPFSLLSSFTSFPSLPSHFSPWQLLHRKSFTQRVHYKKEAGWTDLYKPGAASCLHCKHQVHIPPQPSHCLF